MLQKLEQAIKLAESYRREEGIDGGIVLVYAGQVYGWKNELREPHQERPGALAVSARNCVWLAYGGNDQDGAKSWELAYKPGDGGPYFLSGDMLPEAPSEEEISKAIQDGRVIAVINGKRVGSTEFPRSNV